jgi:hypothetical protein
MKLKKWPAFFQHVKTTNDTNGNPRRLYMVYAAGAEIIGVIEEGYGGKPQSLRNVAEIIPLHITPNEYREVKNWAKREELYFDQ